jgi:hypothetical protein
MEPVSLLLLALNAVLGIAGYLLKNEHRDLKDDNKALWSQVELIKDKYFKKEDFSEFKKELWARFDRLEDDLHRQRENK